METWNGAYLGKVLAAWHDDFPTPPFFFPLFLSQPWRSSWRPFQGMFDTRNLWPMKIHLQPRVSYHPTTYTISSDSVLPLLDLNIQFNLTNDAFTTNLPIRMPRLRDGKTGSVASHVDAIGESLLWSTARLPYSGVSIISAEILFSLILVGCLSHFTTVLFSTLWIYVRCELYVRAVVLPMLSDEMGMKSSVYIFGTASHISRPS